MPIQVLSEVVAAQIAAGEVVERPASVIKELIENSLDAGARTVRVEAETGGRHVIRVTDDGLGIPAEEVELAFYRHATSKLHDIEDLDSIQTLGFRGEALASVAAVAQVTLLTRTADERAGTLLRIDGGRVVEKHAAGTPVGTSITVENLFFNTPARLKFMKAESTERRHIDTVVTRYAMAYPNVRFTLVQDGRVTFSTSGNGSLADVLVEALGVDTVRDMVEVMPLDTPRPDLPPIMVYGFTGLPRLNRNTRSQIILFVNGRHIQDNGLSYAASQAYHTLMPSDRYPVSVLLINLPPEDVDVNVHPTKAEVRFRSPDAVFAAVQRAVRRAVIAQANIPTMTPPTMQDPAQNARLDPWSATPSRSTYSTPSYPNRESEPASQLDLEMDMPDNGRFIQQNPDATRLRLPDHSPYSGHSGTTDALNSGYSLPTVAESWAQRPRTLPPLRIVGQLAAMYILAEGPAGLYLVDQHAAHERILYEQFMAEQAQHRPVAQLMLDSTTVELSIEALALLDAHYDALHKIGFTLEPFGANLIRVQAIPAILARKPLDEVFKIILADLELGDQPAEAALEAQLIKQACKAGAIKAGQTLSYDEMQGLLRQLERCEFPRACPHGRPTMIHISADQLAKEFGRI